MWACCARIVIVSAVALVLACAPAQAATVTSGTTYAFTAASGEENHLTVSLDNGQLTFADTNAPVSGDAGCNSKSAHAVACAVPAGVTPAVQVELGDMADTVSILRVAAVVTGGSGDDLITGGHEADTLSGGSGDDLVDGGTGADTLDGGPGSDTLDYSSRNHGVVVDLASSDPVQGEHDEGDSATGFEKVVGGAGDDVLSGSAAAETLTGGPGNDRLDGRGGPDRLVGGDGRDIADYSARTEDVQLTIGGGPVSGSAADGSAGARDTIDPSTEELAGGAGDDHLTGDAGDNILDGGPGADVLSGGDGEDAADYSSRDEAVQLRDDGRPSSGSGRDGPSGARDTIDTDVEDLWGGSGPDTLTGNSGNNLLSGGPGADVLTGGAGEDAADYSERSDPVIARIDGRPASGNDVDGPPDARDTIAIDVEDLIGGQAADQLFGSSSRNYIDGEGGDDLIDVRDPGADYVDCSGGYDTAWVAPEDIAASDCERIGNGPDTVGTGPGGPDHTPPQVRVSLLGTHPTPATVLRSGLAVHYTCSETCKLDSRLWLGRAAAQDLGIKLGPRRVLVARTAGGRVGRGQGRFTMHLTPRWARALRGRARVVLKLQVVGRDAAGNRRIVWLRLTMTGGKVSLKRSGR